MTAEEILFEAEMSMEKSVDYMVHEFSAVRTGKASPTLVENVDVEAYGSADLQARSPRVVARHKRKFCWNCPS